MENLRLSPLISEDEIKTRVTKIGAEITAKYKGEELVVIGVLNGSFMFFADLVREIKLDVTFDFCGASSYRGGTQSTGEVKLTLDMSRSIRGKHVLLIEDIVDTGLTMNFLKKHIESHEPKSLMTATLLYKPDSLKEKCPIDHIGFKIPNDFVVGYGLDYQGFFRNLPYIAQVSNIN